MSTPQGLRAIETILSGDAVWSFDARAGEWRSCVVTYHSSLAYDDLAVTVRANGEAVRSTWHHPYWVVSGEELDQRPLPDQLDEQLVSIDGVPGRWVDAGDLRPGDVLLSRSGGQSTIEAIETEQTQETVYHIYVEELHNYSVGNAEWLVHNGHGGKNLSDHNPVPRNIRNAYEEFQLGNRFPNTHPGTTIQKVFGAGELRDMTGGRRNKWTGSLEFMVPGSPRDRILQRPDGVLGYVINHDYMRPRVFPAPWYPDGF